MEGEGFGWSATAPGATDAHAEQHREGDPASRKLLKEDSGNRVFFERGEARTGNVKAGTAAVTPHGCGSGNFFGGYMCCRGTPCLL